MSIRYRNKNGQEAILSGLTPGGDIEAGAVAVRKGRVTYNTPVGGTALDVTFDTPMPDADYVVEWEVFGMPGNQGGNLLITPYDNPATKTANGFQFAVYNNNSAAVTFTIDYTAWKIYTVQHAEETANALNEIQAMIPASASSSNQLSTKSDLQAVNRSLDMRLDDIEDVIPNDATIANKLATAEDVAEAMANAGLKVVDTIPVSPQDGDVVLYIGTTTEDYTKGGIYQYDSGTSKWILISTAEVDLSNYATTFVGTKAEWEALTASQKAEYTLVDITDDTDDTNVVVDAVTDGDMHPVTSNAVYDHTKTISGTITFATGIEQYVYSSSSMGPECKKCGKNIWVHIPLTGMPSGWNNILIGTIPEGFRPTRRIGGWAGITTSNGSTRVGDFLINLYPNGELRLFSQVAWTGNNVFSYIVINYIQD